MRDENNIDIEGTVTFDDAEEALTFKGRIEKASDGYSATYFAACGCEIQVSTQVPIQTPILRMKPCKGQLPCKETFLGVMNAAWDGWELEDFTQS